MIEVKIQLGPSNVLGDVFDWFYERGLIFKEDWYWTWDDDDAYGTRRHVFKIRDSQHASLFVLRWL